MTVGASLFLIAVGAIARFAVTDSISGVNLATIGLILIIVGVAGLLIGLFMYANARRTAYREPGYRDRYVDRDPMV